MNKNRYRVLFSKTLQRFIVTSELAKTEVRGKQTGAEEIKCGQNFECFSFLKPLSFSIYCALGFVFLFSPAAYADTLIIKADPTAAANQRPQIMETANGLPQVNIQTPNDKGLSYNRYQQFDVDNKGAILNNSRNQTQTQLGGWVQGNPYLAGGEAKVILNEVNSNDPSRLKGYVEVAGKKADVIIANPNGIHCQGCGVINAERATLTTGKPEIRNGNLESFVVEKGKVTVDGKGLDNSQADYTDIISRSAEINAGVWSQQEVKVTVGKNRISKNNDSVQILHSTNGEKQSENPPHFALDVSQLGGMYAQKIHLVGTEQGLGVRNAGNIGASAGEVIIDANGKIMNRGKLITEEQITLATTHDLENQGSLYAKTDARIRAKNIDNTSGKIVARNIRLETTQLNNSQHAPNSQQALIVATENLSVQAQQVHNRNGQMHADKNLAVNTKHLSHEGAMIGRENAELNVTEDLTLNGGVKANRRLTVTTQGKFTNQAALNAGQEVHVKAREIENRNGGDISAKTTEISTALLTNHGLIDGEQNKIAATRLNNIGSGKIYGNHLSIDSRQLNNLSENQTAATLAARERLDLAVGNLTNRNHSLVLSLGSLFISGQLDENNHAVGKAGFIDNGSATIEALGNGQINAAKLLNQDLHLILDKKSESGHYDRYRPHTSSEWVMASEGWMDWNNRNRHNANAYWHYNDGRPTLAAEDWFEENVDRTTETTVIVSRDPGNISIGGDLQLAGDELINDKSTMAIGGVLKLGDTPIHANKDNLSLEINGTKLSNIDIPGEIIHRETGYLINRKHERKRSKTHHYWYHDPSSRDYFSRTLPVEPFTFKKVLNSIGSSLSLNNNVEARNSTSPVIENADGKMNLPSIYQVQPEAPNGYFIETDPRFTDRKQWLGSDYMFKALRYDPDTMQKRLGDAFYEQRLINEQINQLTGRRFIQGYSSDYEQYKALMDSGIHYAKAFNLVPGIALSKEQISTLTGDMVWIVNEEVTLPNGQKITVLIPKVYLAANKHKITNDGAIISAKRIEGNLENLSNAGTLNADSIALNARNILNQGSIQGRNVALSAAQDLVNRGGNVEAEKALQLTAGNNVVLESQTAKGGYNAGRISASQTDVVRLSSVKTTEDDGFIKIRSGNDIKLKGAQVESAGTLAINAQRHLDVGTINIARREDYAYDNKNYNHLEKNDEVGSQISSNTGSLLIGRDSVTLRQVNLEDKVGTTMIASQGDIKVEEGRQQEHLSSAVSVKVRKTTNTKKVETRHEHDYDFAIGSQISGQNVQLISQQGKVIAQGSDIVAEDKLGIQAQDIEIKEAENRVYSKDDYIAKKSGMMSGGAVGFTIGSQKRTSEADQTKHYSTGSQVGSLNGDTVLIAENNYKQAASSVSAKSGDVNIQAKQINITAADDKYQSNTKQTFEQKGLTIAITSPIIDAINSVQSLAKSAKSVGQSKNDRINAMATANTAFAAKRALESVGTATDAAKALMNSPTSADSAVGISITYGQQNSVSTTHTEGNTAAKSQVNAGGKVNIVATGASGEEKSDINIIGADVSGKGGTNLIADHQVNIKAAEQHHIERSNNKSSGFNAGVAIKFGNGVAFGITAGGNYGKGYGNGDETSYVASHVGTRGSQTTIQSRGDTNIIGSQVLGKKVNVEADNLNIESLQDKATYDGKQMNVSGSVTVGYGFSAGGNFNKSKINADHASVNEQAGIYAGDEGYDINVQKHTDLKGALITSTQQAEDEGKNRLSTATLSHSDIENHSDYSGSSFGLTGTVTQGGGWTGQEKDGVTKAIGFGHDSGHTNDVTRSGINTANIEIRDEQAQLDRTGQSAQTTLAKIKTNVTTDNAEQHSGKLANNFDKEKVQKELDLQREVTQAFDKNRQELKAELYAIVDKKKAEAEEIRKANGGYDKDESKQLDKEANELNEKIRWIDMAMGAVWGVGDSDMLKLAATETQADRVVRSATTPKQMWFQKCSSSNGGDCDARQIWSLNDLTPAELRNLRENGNLLTISNPGIFNDREDSLKNAQKQNTSEANQRGIIVAMNPSTGDYKGWGGWKLLTSLPSELMYAAYDKINDKFMSGALPLTNSQKLNQDLYRQAMDMGYQIDLSNHSRGGLTASVALQDMNNWKGETNIPIRKARFYGTATSVQAYANQLARNGYHYTDKDGKTYQSGAYSAVHQADFVGNKWLLGLVGSNDTTGGACWLCYSHSSYYAEVPDRYIRDNLGNIIRDENGNPKENNQYKDYIKIWGIPKYKGDNQSLPTLVKPTIYLDGDLYNEKPF